MDKSPYEILGVSPDASKDDIKKAYRKKARENHPDLNPNDPQAAERMNQVNEAYDRLMNPEKYAAEDRRRAASQQGAGGAAYDPFGGNGYSGTGGQNSSGQGGGCAQAGAKPLENRAHAYAARVVSAVHRWIGSAVPACHPARGGGDVSWLRPFARHAGNRHHPKRVDGLPVHWRMVACCVPGSCLGGMRSSVRFCWFGASQAHRSAYGAKVGNHGEH